MTLGEQWRAIRAGLPDGWRTARLSLRAADEEQADRAALILGPLAPGRTGATFRLTVERGRDPERVLARLDREEIGATLELVGADAAGETPARAPAARLQPLAAQWDVLMTRLPADWSDLYAEVEVDSTDYLERGALLLAPVNPSLYGGRAGLRFRCARERGYGVDDGMARRCLERLDEERITGTVKPLRVLSRASLAATQGPVWYIGGRSV